MSSPDLKRVPGEAGVWVLLFGDLLAFSIFFLLFTDFRGQQPHLFQIGSASLNRSIGLTNTLLLLTSSLVVAMGVRRVRESRPGAALCFRLAMLLAASFVILKAAEYAQKLSHGITPLTSDFYLYYFAFTGIHLMHVLLGSAGLFVMSRQAQAKNPSPSRVLIVECCGLFWHVVDLLWIVLFALFYVTGAKSG
jgi:nitric oxide reductase NorE protein